MLDMMQTGVAKESVREGCSSRAPTTPTTRKAPPATIRTTKTSRASRRRRRSTHGGSPEPDDPLDRADEVLSSGGGSGGGAGRPRLGDGRCGRRRAGGAEWGRRTPNERRWGLGVASIDVDDPHQPFEHDAETSPALARAFDRVIALQLGEVRASQLIEVAYRDVPALPLR